MTTFLRLLADKDKAGNLLASCAMLRAGKNDTRIFEVVPNSFRTIPGAPFAYWVSEAVRQVFKKLPAFESSERTARQGLATAEDFRFVRTWWEEPGNGWYGFAKGGSYSPFYADIYLMVNWYRGGEEVKAGICRRYPYLNGNAEFVAKNTQFYLRPGLTWPLRTTSGISFRVMPQGCIFGHKGPAVFVDTNSSDELLAVCAISNSQPFGLLLSLQLAAADVAARSYEVGVIQKTPIPHLNSEDEKNLATLARRAWALKRTLDSVLENSHAFILPTILYGRLINYDPLSIDAELVSIQNKINEIVFDLYGFSESDRIAAQVYQGMTNEGDKDSKTDNYSDDDDEKITPIDQTEGLLSWVVGVAFSRFDWRHATAERRAPPEPDPFDPLPTKSSGMLPDGAEPFHHHSGILVDDSGHPHDLPHLIEEVLNRVSVPIPDNVRRWLQKDFFTFHLKLYSKSRRKAPIYWPLSTASGSYTLWIYCPSLTSQTLFTAVNDFLDGPNGKLTQVSRECAELRLKGSSRSSEDEKRYEMLQTFEQELTDLRDTLLKIAPTYQPNHEDGVQITAAPLWPLFRHNPWQKVLKDTWIKLEKGDYDWAHLAMNYWPERVREKCKTDKSLAIAHGLESLYVEPEVAPKKTRSKKKAEIDK